jgi:hypothetical protein
VLVDRASPYDATADNACLGRAGTGIPLIGPEGRRGRGCPNWGGAGGPVRRANRFSPLPMWPHRGLPRGLGEVLGTAPRARHGQADAWHGRTRAAGVRVYGAVNTAVASNAHPNGASCRTASPVLMDDAPQCREQPARRREPRLRTCVTTSAAQVTGFLRGLSGGAGGCGITSRRLGTWEGVGLRVDSIPQRGRETVKWLWRLPAAALRDLPPLGTPELHILRQNPHC